MLRGAVENKTRMRRAYAVEFETEVVWAFVA